MPDSDREKLALLNHDHSAALEFDSSKKQFTTAEIIDYLGFGKAQIIVCLIFSLANLGEQTKQSQTKQSQTKQSQIAKYSQTKQSQTK